MEILTEMCIVKLEINMHHLRGNTVPVGHAILWVILMKFCVVKGFLGPLPYVKCRTLAVMADIRILHTTLPVTAKLN